MLSDTTIGDVGETLVGLLQDNIDNVANDHIVLSSPADLENVNVRLSLFLYSVVETPALKNQPNQIQSTRESRSPPLSLDLYYMLSCYPNQDNRDITDRSKDAHVILGKAMRVFLDKGIVSGSVLRGGLAGTTEELKISLNPITVEDLTRIWSVFPDTPYRTSVSYLVTSARIQSERVVGAQRVIDNVTENDQMVPKNEDS